MSRWKATTFRVAKVVPGGGKRWFQRTGSVWALWAIDERPDGWYLTHLPSGYCIHSPQPTRQRVQAMARALSVVRGVEKITGQRAIERFPKIVAKMRAVLDDLGIKRRAT